jgi:hypothetical protein
VEPIVFKRHLIKCYFAGIAITGAQIVLLTLGLLHVIAIRGTDEFYTHNCVFFISGLILFTIGAFYTGYYYWFNSPLVVIDEDKVSFNEEVVDWQDVQRIELSSLYSFFRNSVFSRFCVVRVAAIYLRNGSFKCVYYSMYSDPKKIQDVLQLIKTSQLK